MLTRLEIINNISKDPDISMIILITWRYVIGTVHKLMIRIESIVHLAPPDEGKKKFILDV